jgi:mannose-6-phosphate isomerase-like protein (cupin superfamily)
MTPSLRELVATDAGAYFRLRAESEREFPEFVGFNGERELRVGADGVAQLLAAYPSEGTVVWGAFDRAQLLGVVAVSRRLTPKYWHKAFLWGLYVSGARRHAGVASALVDAVCSWARRQPELMAISLQVTTGNLRAREFYEHRGFSRRSTERHALFAANAFHDVDSMERTLPPRRNEGARVASDSYASEPIRFAPLRVVDLVAEATVVSEPYRNQVMSRVNGSCLRLAVFNDVFPWHHHPTSDELFLVVEGTLAIDLEGGNELRLGPWQAVTIPAGTIHRTRAIGRVVNLCFEELATDTIFMDSADR